MLLALEHRHRAYLDWLATDPPPGPGPAPVLHAIDRLESWLGGEPPRGCLFLRSLTAHPESEAIAALVRHHKAATRSILAERVLLATPATSDELVDAVFGAHEGAIATAPILGDRAYEAARATVRALIP